MVQELKVCLPSAKVVRTACAEVSPRELRTKELQETIEQLLDFVYTGSNKGESRDRTKPMTVGLSANQVGINKAICVVDFGIGNKRYNDLHVLVNPKIVWRSKTITTKHEGCVNLEHGKIRGLVPRNQRVKVEALDRFGTKLTIDAKGWVAKVLQHEIDHLNGKLFIDHIADPTKAHYVTDDDRLAYLKSDKSKWRKYKDVSQFVRYAKD